MKNWLPSSWLSSGLLFLPLFAFANDVSDAHECLNIVDLACAMKIRDQVLEGASKNEEVLQLHARTLFHEGKYDEVVSVLEQLSELGVDVSDDGGFPARATASAAAGMVVKKGERVLVRHDPGLDQILANDGVNILESSRKTYDTLFGAGPDHDIVMDIFPTAVRFMAASGIPPEAVRNTGVIALSKWNRLLITSPRALARGYAWQDTAAHEYIHLVVAWRSKDQAPVWLQEGLAKYLEKAWRGERVDYLSVHQQSLLATAVKDDSFVPFEKFSRSMAYLDSGDEAALAFAQVATMIDFLQQKAGDKVFPTLMERLAGGEKAEDAVANLAGYGSFYEFKSDWKKYIQTLPLVQEQLASAPIALDGEGGDFADDPLLSNRVDLEKFVRIGDLLFEKGYYGAALIEYAKADDADDMPSPNILARQAQCLLEMKRNEEALKKLNRAQRLYPEHALVLSTAAQYYEKEGQLQKAIEAWEAVHLVNPYDKNMQASLIRLYQKNGDINKEKEHQMYLNILKAGGAILSKGANNAE